LRRLIRDSGNGGNASNGGPEGYAGRMLERFALESPRSVNAASRQIPGIEALSEREVEVLSLVAEGHSNAEIATELYLSVGTVKAHVHHIFGKLLVRNRSQAVARARELHLLD
jgi:LuxR family transcriptional regulator, maltose regulon positive regulatory protein